MGIIENMIRYGDVNVILGDYFVKKLGILSRTELARVFFIEFSSEKKAYIEDINSLSNITQTYLDLALGNRTTLVNKIRDVYDFFNNSSIDENKIEEILISDKVSTIISFDYSTSFEKKYSEILKKITKDNLERERGKTNLYKVFGDFDNSEQMIITDQDTKKFKLLNTYKSYFDTLKEEFYQRKTVVLGDEIKNKDILKMLDYIFSTCDSSKMKNIYFYTKEKNISVESQELIEKYNLKIINSEQEFQELDLELKEKSSQLLIPEILDENIPEKAEKIEILEEIKPNKDESLVAKEIVYLETAAELKLNSLSLKSNPVKYSNINFNQIEKSTKKIETTTITIGDVTINGAKLRILELQYGKLLEIKTREFKIKLSVEILRDKSVISSGEIYEYEIFDGVNSGRFSQVVSLLFNIFDKKPISFKDKLYFGKIEVENTKEKFKLNLINEFSKKFENLKQVKDKRFNLITEDYYKLYLLFNYEKTPEYETWGNFTLSNRKTEELQNPLEYIREHEIKIKGFENLTLRERIVIADELDGGKSVNQYNVFKQKKMKVILEGIKNQ